MLFLTHFLLGDVGAVWLVYSVGSSVNVDWSWDSGGTLSAGGYCGQFEAFSMFNAALS